MNRRSALAILTYVDATRPPEVARRLPAALASLEATGYRDEVIIVDDGSTSESHLEYLDFLSRSRQYCIIRRPTNGGISRAKNTCLRAIQETGAPIGFLAEDDVLFSAGWNEAYAGTMRRSGIQHFSWYLPDRDNRTVACNEAIVTITSGLLGLFLTFTREVLAACGGFKVLPHRYGYEHINWTYRIVQAGLAPFAADIADSYRYVQRNTLPSSLDEEDIREGSIINRLGGYEVTRIHEPLVE